MSGNYLHSSIHLYKLRSKKEHEHQGRAGHVNKNNKAVYFYVFFKTFCTHYQAIRLYMTTAAVKHVLIKEESSSEPCLTNRPSAINVAALILSREPLALIL
jgi:hypothetical protein